MAVLHEERVLKLNADCTEFCPTPGYESLLAVGTYELDEKQQQRHGCLYLFKLAAQQRVSSVELAILDCAGIFDASWFSAASQQALALALSTGSVQLVLVQTHNEDHCWLESQAAVTVTRTAMVLSLDIRDGDGACMGASTSAGDLAIIEVREGGWHISRAWSAHSLEAWTCAFDRHNVMGRWLLQANVLYSGADDSTFRGWDLRCEASALFMDRKAHAAGVCCIQSSPHHEHIVCTGSYDERARLWDTRHISRPLLTAEVCTGGGVWRLKWHPMQPHLLAAACMHSGFMVLHADPASGSLAVHEHYAGQRSLGYGVDWCRTELPAGGLIASCSFYDRLLHLWTPACLSRS